MACRKAVDRVRDSDVDPVLTPCGIGNEQVIADELMRPAKSI